jgi:hypothetical protein
LVAVDSNGAVVLIEEKRDAADISARKEPFEFQAIRYAASYATIETPEMLVERLFTPYVERHRKEYPAQDLTHHELARRTLRDFLDKNNAAPTFNARQKIILIAADFDAQTLSACAWLAANNIDIRCLRLQPHDLSGQTLLLVEQVIPPARLEEYFVSVADASESSKAATGPGAGTRQTLPRMSQLLAWGLISSGDSLYIKGHPDKPATIVDANRVTANGQDMSYNGWGKAVTGWSVIGIYEWAVHEKSGKTLAALRREKMEELEKEAAAVPSPPSQP